MKVKSQLSIEYFIVLILFIIFISYFILQLQLQKPLYIKEIVAERVRSEIYQISEILINDPGYPPNWETDLTSVKRLGLSDTSMNLTNFLSYNKISKIGSECMPGYGYIKIKEWLNSSNDFSLYLIDKSDNNKFLIVCSPPEIKPTAVNTTISRFITFDKDGSRHYGELILQMW